MENIKKQLEQANKQVEAIEKQLFKEYFKIFDDDNQLREAINKAENGEFNSFIGEFDGVYGLIDFDYSKYQTDDAPKMIEALKEYVDDYCINIIDADTLGTCLGPAILFNTDDLAIYDQDDQCTIFSFSESEIDEVEDYRELSWNEIELIASNEIEKYQQDQGVFNWVFTSDRYGNLDEFHTLDIIKKNKGE